MFSHKAIIKALQSTVDLKRSIKNWIQFGDFLLENI